MFTRLPILIQVVTICGRRSLIMMSPLLARAGANAKQIWCLPTCKRRIPSLLLRQPRDRPFLPLLVILATRLHVLRLFPFLVSAILPRNLMSPVWVEGSLTPKTETVGEHAA